MGSLAEVEMRVSYEIQGNYGFGHRYETVTAEDSFPEAKQRLREYYENEPGIPFRIRRVE
jgi:hypothetical protein